MADNDYKVLLQAIIDASKVKDQVDNIKDLALKIEKLNLSPKAIADIKSQLEKNGINLNINGINMNGASQEVAKQAQNIGKQAGQQIVQGINNSVQKDAGALPKVIENVFGNTGNITDQVKKNFGQVSEAVRDTIKVIEQIDDKNGLKSFTVQLTNAEGAVEKLRYSLTTLKNGKNVFQYAGGSIDDSSITKSANDVIKVFNQYEAKLTKLKDGVKGVNLGQPLKEFEASLAGLKNGTSSIDELKNAFARLEQEASNANANMRSTAGSLNPVEAGLARFRNSENTISALVDQFVRLKEAPKGVATELINIKNKLEEVKAIEASEGKTVNWTAKYHELDQAITDVTNKLQLAEQTGGRFKTSMSNILTARDNGTYSAQIEELRQKFVKYGLSVDESKAKVKGLTTLLSRMNTQSGTGLVTSTKKLEQEFSNVNAKLKEAKNNYDKFAQPVSELKITALVNRLDSFLTKNTRITKEARQELEKYKIELAGGNISLNRWNEINNVLKQTENRMRAFGKLGYALKDQFSQAASSFAQWMSVTTVMMGTINKAREAIGTISELNDQIVEISKVSESSAEYLDGLTDKAFDVGSAYGRTAQEYLASVETMNRAGFQGESGEQMAQLSLMAQTAGDMNEEVADKFLLSANAAYQLQGNVESLQAVLDSADLVSNKYAVSMTDMANGFSIAGSTAANAGLDVKEYIALVGTGVATTQKSGDEIGNGLKSIITNLQNTSSSKIVGTFEKAGVAMTEMKDDIESLREPMDVLRDLAKVYNELDEKSTLKSEISRNLAGKYQASTFASLLTNFDQVEEQLATAQNASGTASKELEKALDSVSAKLKELNNTFTQTINNIVNSDGIKAAIDSLNVFVSTIEKVSHSLGGIGTILLTINFTKFISGVSSMNKALEASSKLNKFSVGKGLFDNDQLQGSIRLLDGLSKKELEVAISSSRLSKENKELIASHLGISATAEKTGSVIGSVGNKIATTAKSIGLALKSMIPMMAISGAIEIFTILKDAFDKAHPSVEKLKNNLEDSLSAYKSTCKEIEDLKSQISDTSEKIKELAALAKNNKISVVQQGELDKLEEQNKKLEKQIKLKQTLANSEAEKTIYDAKSAMTKMDLSDYLKNFRDKQSLGIQMPLLNIRFGDDEQSQYKALLEYKDIMQKLMDNSPLDSDEYKGYESSYMELSNVISGYEELVNSISDAYGTLEENGKTLDENRAKEYSTVKDLQDLYIEYNYTQEKTIENYDKLNKEQKKNQILSSLKSKGLNERQADAVYNGLDNKQIDNFVDKSLPNPLDFDQGNVERFAKDFVSTMFGAVEDEAKKQGKKTGEVTIKSIWFEALSNSETKSVAKEIEKLASAGELTPQTLSSTKEYNTLLKELGISAQQLSDYIHSTMSDTEQMNAFAKAMGDISSAYEQFKSKGSNTTSTLSGLEGAFGNLNSFKEFTNIVGDASSSTAQMQNAYNKLVDEYVSSIGILDTITESNKGYVETQLKALGVQNAEAIVSDVLNGKLLSMADTKRIMKKYNLDLAKSSASEIASLSAEGKESTKTADALLKLAVRKQGVNKTTITTDGDINNLVSLAIAGSKTAQILLEIATVKEKLNKGIGEAGTAGGRQVLKAQLENLESQLKSITKGGNRANSVLGSTSDAIDKQNKSTSTANKGWNKFSQTIDWASKTVSMLTSKISLLNAELGNTTNVSKQISAYNELIKAQKKLIEGYESSESTYSKQYKNALKKLSSKDQKKVKDGTYTIENFKGKAKSGKTSAEEKRYNQITKALNARDNWMSAKTNTEGAIKQLNEYAEALANVRWDEAQTKVDKLNNSIDLLNSSIENADTYEEKIDLLNQELDLRKQIVKEEKSAIKKDTSSMENVYSKINSKYKKKSRTNSDGTLSTVGVTDEKQLTYIAKYNAYLKQVNEATVELNKNQATYKSLLKEQAVTNAGYIQNEFNNKLELIDSRMNRIDNNISMIEARGSVVASDYYKQLQEASEEKIRVAQMEKRELEQQLDKTKEYTDAWYELKSMIASCDETMQSEGVNAVEAIKNQIEAIDELNDKTNEYIDSISGSLALVGEFSKEDMYDDNGALTNSGKAYYASVEANKTEKAKTVANNKETLTNFENNKDSIIKDVSEDYYNEKHAEYLKQYQDSYKELKDLEKEELELVTEGLTKQKDALNEIIDLKKKALNADKEAYEYQKSLAEKTKNITDLQKQLTMLQGNNSEEAMAQKVSISKQLDDAQTDLEDTQYSKMLDRQENFLDDIVTDYEDMIKDYEDNKALALEELTNILTSISESDVLNGLSTSVGEEYSSVIGTDAMSAIRNAVASGSMKYVSTQSIDKKGLGEYLSGSGYTIGSYGTPNVSNRTINNAENVSMYFNVEDVTDAKSLIAQIKASTEIQNTIKNVALSKLSTNATSTSKFSSFKI